MALKPDVTTQTYNKIAQDWHHDHLSDDRWIKSTNKFIKLLPPQPTILDVGCGGGIKSAYFIEHDCRVVGIDSSEEMIKIATKEVPQGTFKTLDIREIDQLSDQFDGIYLLAVLLHLQKQELPAILTKLVSKLTPAGVIYLSVKEIRANQPEEEMKTENDYGYPYERFFSYFTLDEIAKLLREANLTIFLNKVNHGPSNWIESIARNG